MSTKYTVYHNKSVIKSTRHIGSAMKSAVAYSQEVPAGEVVCVREWGAFSHVACLFGRGAKRGGTT